MAWVVRRPRFVENLKVVFRVKAEHASRFSEELSVLSPESADEVNDPHFFSDVDITYTIRLEFQNAEAIRAILRHPEAISFASIESLDKGYIALEDVFNCVRSIERDDGMDW